MYAQADPLSGLYPGYQRMLYHASCAKMRPKDKLSEVSTCLTVIPARRGRLVDVSLPFL